MNRQGWAIALWGGLFLGASLVASTLRATERDALVGKQMPALHVGAWIRGSRQVGTWGDGRTYVLDLWGTWCKPCVEGIPKLTQLQATYRDRGLVVIGYSWEKPEIVRAFVKRMGTQMRYAVVADPEEVTLDRLTELEAVQSFPYAFLIDRNGRVVWAGHPKNDDLEGAVARLFAEPPKNRAGH